MAVVAAGTTGTVGADLKAGSDITKANVMASASFATVVPSSAAAGSALAVPKPFLPRLTLEQQGGMELAMLEDGSKRGAFTFNYTLTKEEIGAYSSGFDKVLGNDHYVPFDTMGRICYSLRPDKGAPPPKLPSDYFVLIPKEDSQPGEFLKLYFNHRILLWTWTGRLLFQGLNDDKEPIYQVEFPLGSGYLFSPESDLKVLFEKLRSHVDRVFYGAVGKYPNPAEKMCLLFEPFSGKLEAFKRAMTEDPGFKGLWSMPDTDPIQTGEDFKTPGIQYQIYLKFKRTNDIRASFMFYSVLYLKADDQCLQFDLYISELGFQAVPFGCQFVLPPQPTIKDLVQNLQDRLVEKGVIKQMSTCGSCNIA